MDGGIGADTMIGGTGNDIYWVDNTGDLVTEASAGGTDTVRSRLSSYTLGANLENLDMRYAPPGPVYATGNSLNNIFYLNGGVITVNGGSGSDTANYFTLSMSILIDRLRAREAASPPTIR